VHPIADIHRAGDDLASDPKAQISLVAGPHHADELAVDVAGLERDLLHLHRALGLASADCARSLHAARKGSRESANSRLRRDARRCMAVVLL